MIIIILLFNFLFREEGVPELLEVEDMVRMESPDPKSVITYLHSIYQVFVADRR